MRSMQYQEVVPCLMLECRVKQALILSRISI
jgi:hypothetical protein